MDLYSKLAANMEEITNNFEVRMKQYEDDLKQATGVKEVPPKDIVSLSKEFSDFKTLIWKTISIFKSQLELLLHGLDRHETTSRRKVLLFHGINEAKDQNIEDTVVQLLCNKMKLSGISSHSISNCHRLGPITNKPRPILVRFVHYNDRSMVWNKKTAFKDTGIIVSEFLTKARHSVFMAARNHFGIKQCWTSEGRIVILLPDKNRRKIELMSELRQLISQYTVQSAMCERPARDVASAIPTASTENVTKKSKPKRIVRT